MRLSRDSVSEPMSRTNMIGKIFITRCGYDPQLGKLVKDPFLGEQPSLGACRPDIRRKLMPGDEIFAISGKIKGFSQFVMGGFEVAAKLDVREAFERFPEQRLYVREDGQLDLKEAIAAAPWPLGARRDAARNCARRGAVQRRCRRGVQVVRRAIALRRRVGGRARPGTSASGGRRFRARPGGGRTWAASGARRAGEGRAGDRAATPARGAG